MTRVDTGLLLFLEDPSRTAARWPDAGEIGGSEGERLLAALHRDQVQALAGSEQTATYLAPAAAHDQEYVQRLAEALAVEILEVPGTAPLERWDSGLCILFNRCAHRKILAVNAGVPDIGAEDIARARRKLDLYRMILGREGEDRCWLVGLNGYEEVLGSAEVRPDDVLHPLLQAAGRVGLDVSLLDTKPSLGGGLPLDLMRGLARQPGYSGVAAVLGDLGLSGKAGGPSG